MRGPTGDRDVIEVTRGPSSPVPPAVLLELSRQVPALLVLAALAWSFVGAVRESGQEQAAAMREVRNSLDALTRELLRERPQQPRGAKEE